MQNFHDSSFVSCHTFVNKWEASAVCVQIVAGERFELGTRLHILSEFQGNTIGCFLLTLNAAETL